MQGRFNNIIDSLHVFNRKKDIFILSGNLRDLFDWFQFFQYFEGLETVSSNNDGTGTSKLSFHFNSGYSESIQITSNPSAWQQFIILFPNTSYNSSHMTLTQYIIFTTINYFWFVNRNTTIHYSLHFCLKQNL